MLRNRDTFRWGTYGKDGKSPYKTVLLKDMSVDHIQAVLKTQNNGIVVERLMLSELNYRGVAKDV